MFRIQPLPQAVFVFAQVFVVTPLALCQVKAKVIMARLAVHPLIQNPEHLRMNNVSSKTHNQRSRLKISGRLETLAGMQEAVAEAQHRKHNLKNHLWLSPTRTAQDVFVAALVL